MSRPGLILLFFVLISTQALAEPDQPTATPLPANSAVAPFAFSEVVQKAKELARRAYSRDDAGIPEFLSDLDYDHYRDIRYRGEKALWADEGLPFQLQLFHRGFMFRDRVSINIVDQGVATRLAYSPDLFDFGNNAFPAPMPPDLGFAGLRVHYPLRRDDTYDEITVFLGASYFRAIGLGQTYGISARGMAVDTGLAKAEEFPIFREFWIEKPAKDATTLTLYALLDSESVTGAYRFVIRPGYDLTLDVSQHVFFRRPVERVGIAPLTSMFFHGENTDRFMDDFRPEVHDSDGLLLSRSNGEWLWRPLNNPRQLRISVFRDSNPGGFGLMKRDRVLDHYQDFEANYHLRPSAWVEALGQWGGGAVYLIEIPSDAEKYDNIVAFWVPEQNIKEGTEMNFDYRLHFMLGDALVQRGGKVVSTRVGAGNAGSTERASRKFAVDFAGDTLKLLSDKAKIEADVSTSSGEIRNVVVQKNGESGLWRLSFDLLPAAGSDPAELRAVLRSGPDVLSETWLYQWNTQ